MKLLKLSSNALEASSVHLFRWAAPLAGIALAAALGCNSSTVTPTTRPPAGSATGETGSTTAPATPVVKSVPPALAQMGEYGENIYDAAKAGKWKDAESKLASLKNTVQSSAQDLSGAPNERGQLDATLTALDHAVPHHDKSATMRDANQVTFLAAELTAPYHPKIPSEVARLDFDGRELEIWSAAHNVPKLKRTAEDIHHTWDQVRPEVEAHNGQSAAKGFDALVAKVDHAHTAAQYHAVANPLLDQVDKLESVF